MGKIIILDENTANKIAAGEVVERPASVVKELVENSIDAGADTISIEIRNGGVSFIKITDNGSGIDEDDAEIAFERHATSKIRSANDLEAIATLGFRGEALASIAAVSTVELTTKVRKNSYGTFIRIQGGVVKEIKQTGCPVGTTFVVRDLFFNTPARYKFLKKDSTEAGYVSDIISRIALAKPNISFKLLSSGSQVMHTPGNNDLLSAIYAIYGKETAKEVSEIKYEDSKIKITGYAGKPAAARSNRNQQSVFINGRFVKSKIITSAIDEVYKTILMKGKYAFIVLNMEINPLLIDVNVHPTKMEVRFSEEHEVFRSVYHAVTNALLDKSLINTVTVREEASNPFKHDRNEFVKKEYVQQNIEFEKLVIREDPVQQKADVVNKMPAVKVASKEDYYPPEEKAAVSELEKHIESQPKSVISERINGPAATELPKSEIKPAAKSAEVRNDLINARIIGQAFSTYIMLQNNDELLMLDQHAAHERIVYERLVNRYKSHEPISQMLVAPLVVELTYQELKLLEEKKEFFSDLGFLYECFGNNSIILRSVPDADESTSIKETFTEILDKVMRGAGADISTKADDILFTIACKAAVKANKKLGEMEIKELIKELSLLDNPYTCPHGRPIIIRITKYELEKKFKRIV